MAPLAPTASRNFAAFGMFALAVVPFVLVAPAHADSISIDLDATAVTLQHSGNLYKHNSSVRVRNSNTYGFTLSMNASQPNLVNDKDSTYKIDSVSGTNQKLAANQWGYGMGKDATTFNSVSSATLAGVTSDSKGNCNSVDDCTLYLTFGANLDQKRLPTGSYSTSLTYTATSKPAPYVPPAPEPPKPKWTTNGCKVDCDDYMTDYGFSCEDSQGNYYKYDRDKYTSDYVRYDYTFQGDNCAIVGDYGGFYGKFKDSLIKRTSDGWHFDDDYRHKFDYSNGNWAMMFDDSFNKRYDIPDILSKKNDEKVLVYIPRFVKEGHHIRFCDDSRSSGCTDNDVDPAFKFESPGFWISATEVGCLKYTKYDEFGTVSSEKSERRRAANILVEAFGSPCSK